MSTCRRRSSSGRWLLRFRTEHTVAREERDRTPVKRADFLGNVAILEKSSNIIVYSLHIHHLLQHLNPPFA